MVRAIGAPEAKHLFALAHSVGGVDLVWVGRFGVRVRVRVRVGVRVGVRARVRVRVRVLELLDAFSLDASFMAVDMPSSNALAVRHRSNSRLLLTATAVISTGPLDIH